MSAAERIIRDPLYDYISYPKAGVISDLVDSPEFQRLRMIRQLGTASYVFPNAEHNRFSHSLGCYHLSKKFDRLLSNGEEINIELYIGALLHDIGHMPLSHVLEGDVFNVKHEVRTVEIIKNSSSRINEVLELHKIDPKKVADLISNASEPNYHHRLISSQLDVDRFDYLRRDSYFTGNPCGMFDLERVMRTVKLNDDSDIRVPPKGYHSVQNYLMSRFSMYHQVYFHKTKVCLEGMLIKVMKRAQYLIAEGKIEADTTFKRLLGGQSLSQDEYNSLTDNDVFVHLNQWRLHNDLVIKELSKCILERKLLKPIYAPKNKLTISNILGKKASIDQALISRRYDPDNFFIIVEKDRMAAYSPYSPDPEDQDDAILTEDGEDIKEKVMLPEGDGITLIFTPEKCREDITRIICT
jgi:HD superfamily phosphohydrolase